MAIYLMVPDPSNDQVAAIQERLQKIIPEARKITKVDDVADEIKKFPQRRNVVIYVVPSISSDGITQLINISTHYHQRIFLILVSNEISATDYKRLIQSGGADWVAATSKLEEIPELIHKQTVGYPTSNSAEAKTKPVVISFLPSVGGVGNTTIALEALLQIKHDKAYGRHKLAYVDLDFQTSHVCDFLDIEPRLQIAEIFDRPERLDDQLFELFISHDKSGIDVFAAPRSKLDPCEINIEGLDALLGMVQRRYDFIFLDLPVSWYSWTVPIIENSTAVILTGVNTIPCLHQMRATLDMILKSKTPSAQVAIVINRITRGILGRVKRQRHVKSVLTGESIFYVREDPLAINRVNTGTPLARGGTGKSSKDYINIAVFCTKVQSRALEAAAR